MSLRITVPSDEDKHRGRDHCSHVFPCCTNMNYNFSFIQYIVTMRYLHCAPYVTVNYLEKETCTITGTYTTFQNCHAILQINTTDQWDAGKLVQSIQESGFWPIAINDGYASTRLCLLTVCLQVVAATSPWFGVVRRHPMLTWDSCQLNPAILVSRSGWLSIQE